LGVRLLGLGLQLSNTDRVDFCEFFRFAEEFGPPVSIAERLRFGNAQPEFRLTGLLQTDCILAANSLSLYADFDSERFAPTALAASNS
jgi:hypothetical protein